MKLRIIREENPVSPREWDNLGTFYMRHRRYSFGDKNAENIDQDNFQGEVLPVYMYDHSGITINTTGFSCPWDSGQIGIIYVTDEKIREEYRWKRLTKKRRAFIRDLLKGEIADLDTYLRGEIYGYRLFDESGEEIDSCWGFFGDDPKKNGMAHHVDLTNLDIEYGDCA